MVLFPKQRAETREQETNSTEQNKKELSLSSMEFCIVLKFYLRKISDFHKIEKRKTAARFNQALKIYVFLEKNRSMRSYMGYGNYTFELGENC